MKALIVVDVQNDFLPGGALAVPQGDEIIPLVNRLSAAFPVVVATQDWHPEDHGSFAANHPEKEPGDAVHLEGVHQRLWPVHCVQGQPGAEFHHQVENLREAHIVRKGTDPTVDSYSGFYDNGRRKATGLGDLLRQNGVDEVYIVGLATDYCVKFTALDAVGLGYTTFVIPEACRGVDLQPGDSDRALEELQSAGVGLLSVEEALRRASQD